MAGRSGRTIPPRSAWADDWIPLYCAQMKPAVEAANLVRMDFLVLMGLYISHFLFQVSGYHGGHLHFKGRRALHVIHVYHERVNDNTITAADKIAVLIDGDNAEASLISEFIAEAGRFGRVTVKRIYADWTSPQMSSWKDQLNSFAVRPIQKFAYTKSKSSTDTALIIDAMDLLHSKLVDGFCIVSSDSDYTGLAHRIREEGLFSKHLILNFCHL